jgi:hypothetical protein
VSKLYIGVGIVGRAGQPSHVEALAATAPSREEAEGWARGILGQRFSVADGWDSWRIRMYPIERHRVATWLAAYDDDKLATVAGSGGAS